MRFLAAYLINAGSLLLLAWLLPAIRLDGFGTALWVALVLGLVNVFIRPVLLVLTLPINLLTLGLFTLLINGFCFWLVARWLGGFALASFADAVLAAFCYSVISWLATSLLLGPEQRA